jgi:hypothetical protein
MIGSFAHSLMGGYGSSAIRVLSAHAPRLRVCI